MPQMNGLELQKRLHEMGVDLPIVFISGSVDIPTAFQAIKGARWTFCKSPIPRSCCWKLLAAKHCVGTPPEELAARLS